MKSTFSLASGRQVFVSQHLGDLENEETLTAYRAILHRYCELFAVTPAAVALDAHPDYLSSRFARQYAVEHSLAPSTVVEVQHHHAHIAACMADNGLSGQVIGVAFDGTGFGSDGTVWGGEFLLADYQGFSRVGWLRPFRLPGGDAAVVSPYRSAFALCDMAGIARQSVITLLQRHFPGFALTQSELMVVEKQLRGELPAPLCSSVGRLFDAVAVLSGACLRSDFEGQAAVALEQVSCQADEGEYELPIEQFGDHFVVNPNSLVRAVVSDAFGGVTADKIGARFHRALADAVVNGCLAMRKELDLQRVCLSGGVFQNQLLLKLTLPALAEAGFDVFIHHQVPCNDGGISLGQAAIAACRLGSTCTK